MLPDLPQTEIAIIDMTNAFRKEQKLGEVKPNAALTAAARAFAQYLASTGRFAHEADGRAPHQRAEAAGYRYCFVAENLAMNLDSRGFETKQLARQAMDGWKASPGHRENLLQPVVTEIGVGVARATDRNPKFISVQLVGRPVELRIKFVILNQTMAALSYAFGKGTHTLPPRTSVTYTSCEAGELRFDKAGGTVRETPRDGDRFVVRGPAGSPKVSLERK